jgi:hypothetical protein
MNSRGPSGPPSVQKEKKKEHVSLFCKYRCAFLSSRNIYYLLSQCHAFGLCTKDATILQRFVDEYDYGDHWKKILLVCWNESNGRLISSNLPNSKWAVEKTLILYLYNGKLSYLHGRIATSSCDMFISTVPFSFNALSPLALIRRHVFLLPVTCLEIVLSLVFGLVAPLKRTTPFRSSQRVRHRLHHYTVLGRKARLAARSPAYRRPMRCKQILGGNSKIKVA